MLGTQGAEQTDMGALNRPTRLCEALSTRRAGSNLRFMHSMRRKRPNNLEQETARLKRLVAGQPLDIQIPKGIAKGEHAASRWGNPAG